jgi:hypothetical protein
MENFNEEFDTFNQQFRRYTGSDLKETMAEIKELREWRKSESISKQEASLRKRWNVETDEDFSDRIGAVRERFNALPETTKALYDSVDGADMLWAHIQNERSMNQSNSVNSSLDKSSSLSPRQSAQKYRYIQTDVDNMSRAEYGKIADDYALAVNEGAVLFE